MPSVKFLGHSCVEIKGEKHTILIDPFLTGNEKATVSADDVEADLSDSDALSSQADDLPQTKYWYVSNLVRARQTAKAVCNGAQLTVVPEFNEQDFGDWNGLTWDEAPKDAAGEFWRDSVYAAPPNGASSEQALILPLCRQCRFIRL